MPQAGKGGGCSVAARVAVAPFAQRESKVESAHKIPLELRGKTGWEGHEPKQCVDFYS